ncbi:Aromatic prenyltransferase Orf2 [Amycolatopsis xylanica]|uniref:Aromatic prenyltransferase Orf2 n=1 Tax=Amycolatopsis xylanica TaxID=589385 RepID=A0A1H3JUI3_9PSEU|nr:aromatic prenyltransferase [Amycolatopsis xylanica]SDY43541.1 Aromatic prenyltransferase Orf2 [Amycolatopsis xylanica]
MTFMSPIEQLYRDIEHLADALGAVCERDRVMPCLAAFSEGFAGTGLAFRTTTKAGGTPELSYRYTGFGGPSPDPYPIALRHGLLPAPDGLVDKAHQDIARRLPVDLWGADFGTTTGIEKIYATFGVGDAQPVPRIAALPSMPIAIDAEAGFFARYGLGDVGLMAVDVRSRTVNLYFHPAPGTLTPGIVARMLGDLELAIPADEAVVRRCADAFSVYFTFSWASPRIERVCFPLFVSARELAPLTQNPILTAFAEHAPFEAGPRYFVHAAAMTPVGYYFKLENIYRYYAGEFWDSMAKAVPHWREPALKDS